MYYCKSGYYFSEFGRYINTVPVNDFDGLKMNELNLYSFAHNDFINKVDLTNKLTVDVNTIRLIGLDNIYKYYMFSKKRQLIPHSLPVKDQEPGSVLTQHYPDGTLARERVFDEEGKAKVDHDWHDGEEVGYEHDHEWDWNKTPPRQDPTAPKKIVAAIGLVTSALALVWFVGNDITGIGVSDDAFIPGTAAAMFACFALLFEEETK